MKTSNLVKLAVALPLIGYAWAANAAILVDTQNNVSYSGAEGSILTINADGAVLVDNTPAGKCAGGESAKVTKAKLGTITCDTDYVKVRDKKGNELTRYSSYAKASANGVEERKLFDESLAKIGSGTTGAAALSQSTVVENKTVTTTKTVTLEPGPGYLGQPRPKPAEINQTNYTPKLGTMASKTPAVTKTNTPQAAKADKAVAEAEKKAKAAPPGATNVTITEPEIIIRSTEPSPNVEQTVKTTTTIKPVPSAEAKGATPATTVQTKTKTVPAEPAAEPAKEPKKDETEQQTPAN